MKPYEMEDLTLSTLNWELCIASLDDCIRDLEECREYLVKARGNIKELDERRKL